MKSPRADTAEVERAESGVVLECSRCELLVGCRVAATSRYTSLGRLHSFRVAAGLALMRGAKGLFSVGLRWLHPDCPVRRSLEALDPLVSEALSLSSTKRRQTS